MSNAGIFIGGSSRCAFPFALLALRAVLLAVAIAGPLASSASAQEPGSEQACDVGKAADPDGLIAACTALLRSSNEPSRQVAALVARASAYTKSIKTIARLPT